MTIASPRFFPLGQIHIAFGDPHLSPGSGNQRLVLQTKITSTWLDPDVPTSTAVALLVGTVWTDQPHFRWLAGLESQVITLRGFAVDEELVVSLSDEQLIALERSRGEGDIALRLKLQLALLPPFEGVHPITNEEISFRIPRARWLEMLDQVGTEVGILIRVPSPLADSPTETPPTSAGDAGSLTQATARLRQARMELRDQQWEHCVATCRRVLENIARLVNLPPASAVSKTRVEDRNQDMRWAAIYYDVKSMASAAHHDDETTEGFTWWRADAEAILAATAGLLARYTSGR